MTDQHEEYAEAGYSQQALAEGQIDFLETRADEWMKRNPVLYAQP